MTRRWWMRLIPAVLVPVAAKACTYWPDGTLVCSSSDVISGWEQSGKPINNQCPVCGLIGKGFKNPKLCIGSDGLQACESDEHLTRCSRCNAAFWQDAV